MTAVEIKNNKINNKGNNKGIKHLSKLKYKIIKIYLIHYTKFNKIAGLFISTLETNLSIRLSKNSIFTTIVVTIQNNEIYKKNIRVIKKFV